MNLVLGGPGFEFLVGRENGQHLGITEGVKDNLVSLGRFQRLR